VTITVTATYKVHSAQTLNFKDEAAFFIHQIDKTPNIINAGTVNVRGDSVTAIENAGYDGFYGGVIWNKVGATIHVMAATSGTGYYGGSWGTNLLNDGSFQIEAGQDASGFTTWSPDATVVNNGVYEVTAAQAANGVDLVNGGDFTNTGQFHIAANSASGVSFSYYGGNFTNAGEMLIEGGESATGVYAGGAMTNTGTLTVTDTSKQAEGVAFDGGYTLDNSGTIHADVAVRNVVSLTNSGTILGVVDLGDDASTVDNSGVMRGRVLLGYGDDSMNSAAGRTFGGVYGGDGNDSITGGRWADHLFGDNGSDGGQDGADVLVGGKGDDFLNGNGGKDILTGGIGADQITGGLGADTFVYTSLRDSLVDKADVITDLRATDHIDVSALDADTTMAGDQAFTLVAALDGHSGELAMSYDASTDVTHLLLDVTGDGVADSMIDLAGDQTGFTGFVY
jgi:Ca2+-binding RTX toxin-like protein